MPRCTSIRTLVGVLVFVCTSPLYAASAPAVHAERGMVASRSMLASEVGADILRAGGNAIDAAVATGFALAVTYPSAGNLGGGGFMVIRLADGTVVTNDHREVAPQAAHRDMYLDDQGNVQRGLSTASHLAVGVPGTVDGLLAVLERYGTMKRERVLAPAIRLAQQGFELNYDLASQFVEVVDDMQRYPASVAVFTRSGEPYRKGDVWKQRDLAATLKRIARKGRAGFYEGSVADAIVAEMQRNRGLITHDDLRAYRSKWRESIHGTYRGYDIYTMPPPSSGGVLLVQMLNMLEPYDVRQSGFGAAATVHLMVEAERRAYADRAEHLGDPDFHPVPVTLLTGKAYARKRFADFNPEGASLSSNVGPGRVPPEESPQTTHASIVDAVGNAVAYTTTLNLGFGSKIVATGSGVLLNNEMDDFSVKQNTPNSFGLIGRLANEIQPGKRMLSSMTPTVVTKDGKLVLVTGSPGGSTIITTVLQVLVNTIDHQMDISDAVGAPRFHHQWQPDRVIYEWLAFSPDTKGLLTKMGHAQLLPLPFPRSLGDANSIRIVDGVLWGMSDPRNDGGAKGY